MTLRVSGLFLVLVTIIKPTFPLCLHQLPKIRPHSISYFLSFPLSHRPNTGCILGFLILYISSSSSALPFCPGCGCQQVGPQRLTRPPATLALVNRGSQEEQTLHWVPSLHSLCATGGVSCQWGGQEWHLLVHSDQESQPKWFTFFFWASTTSNPRDSPESQLTGTPPSRAQSVKLKPGLFQKNWKSSD